MMLTSSFMENSNTVSGERKVYEVVVEETDFVMVYWLLKYSYANWVLFKDHDDLHVLVALLKYTSYLVGSDGVSGPTKLSKQAEFQPAIVPNIVMLLRDSNATVQSNGELPWWSLLSMCLVYEKCMHYIMKFSVHPKRPSTITTGGITIGIGAVT
ncbi:hypothetical protein BU17DRAFT_60526 [Hysterangium stoloniferum]|nr:hypothetical protein BU17DRAFT_60526 [Hysterangium stoloniferum]